MTDRVGLGVFVLIGAYLLLAAACAGVSGWSTYHGLLGFGPMLALIIAGVIFIALMFCHALILHRRLNGSHAFRPDYGLVTPILVLLFVTSLSASSSFVYFYSLVQRDPYVQERLVKARQDYESNFSTAVGELKTRDTFKTDRQATERVLVALREQVYSKGNEGFGDIAMRHVAELEQKMRQLGFPLTPYRYPQPPGSKSLNEPALVQIEMAVGDRLNKLEKSDAVSEALAGLTAERSRVATELTSEPKTADEAVRYMQRLSESSAKIERTTNANLSPIEDRDGLALARIDAGGLGLFTMPEVYDAAFTRGVAPGVTAGSIFVACLLDLLPLLVAMMLQGRGERRLDSDYSSVRPRKDLEIVLSSRSRRKSGSTG